MDLLKENAEFYLEDNRTVPATDRLKGSLGLNIRFRESKAQLLKVSKSQLQQIDRIVA